MGLHADPRRAQESRAPCGTLNDCTDPADARDLAGAGTPDLVADVPARALGCDRWLRISSRPKSGRGVAWSRSTRSLSSTWPRGECRSSGRRRILTRRSWARSRGPSRRRTVGSVVVLICDRDAKWSTPFRTRLQEAGIRVIQTPYRAPNANAHAERFVRSIKGECLNRLIPFGERHLRQAVAEFIAHYHGERNHQGLRNELIEGQPAADVGRIRRRHRLGGLLNYYARAA